mgnify:FL=1
MLLEPELESMPRPQLEKLQLERLQKLVARVYEKVPFYKNAFDEKGIQPSDLKTLKDFARFPFTYKNDLRTTYPFGLVAVPKSEYARIHASSGTTGKPTVVVYTANDLKVWADVMGRSFFGAGINENDILQNAFGYGLFTGGLGAHGGGERLKAAILPASGGNSKRQITLMRDLGVTALCCTPSYAVNLLETAQDLGYNPREFALKKGVFGAEPWTNELRQTIENGFGIDAVDIYGLSEIIGPGVACECVEEKNGMHINEDHFYVETINPDTGEVLPAGEVGELVLTTITKEGMPLIRYRTRDISVLNTEKCRCGRTFYRMQKVIGRSDDMLIIRGVNVFPSQIEDVLLKVAGTAPHYMIVVEHDEVRNMDKLEVQVELSQNLFSDVTRNLQELEAKITRDIKDIIGITTKVRLVEQKSLARFEGKAQRVIDKRKK